MILQVHLEKYRAAILEAWLQRILQTYPDKTRKFLADKKDPFSNPVGNTLKSGMERILGCLIEGGDLKERTSVLEEIVKIRAVQEFSPSQAIGFVFELKSVVRSTLREDYTKGQLAEALVEFEKEVDQLGLLAFDVYSLCRERISELRIHEIKRTGYRLLRKADLISSEEDVPSTSSSVEVGGCR